MDYLGTRDNMRRNDVVLFGPVCFLAVARAAPNLEVTGHATAVRVLQDFKKYMPMQKERVSYRLSTTEP